MTNRNFNENDIINFVNLLKFLKEEQQQNYMSAKDYMSANEHQYYEEGIDAVLKLIEERFPTQKVKPESDFAFLDKDEYKEEKRNAQESVKIEDFISKDILDKMTDREREIYESSFLLNMPKLQGLTDAINLIKSIKDKMD